MVLAAVCLLYGALCQQHEQSEFDNVVASTTSATPAVSSTSDASSQVDTGIPTPEPAEIPQTMPFYRTGLSLLDDYIIRPVLLSVRLFRSGFRGTLTALRDLLFPQFRPGTRADGTKSFSPLDKVMDDEGWDDYERRTALRMWLLKTCDQLGISEFSTTKPTEFRYGLAVIVGVTLLAMVLGMQSCTACCARHFLRALFKFTDNEAWLDESDLTAKWASEAEAEARQQVTQEANVQQARSTPNAAPMPDSTSGQARPAQKSSGSARKRK